MHTELELATRNEVGLGANAPCRQFFPPFLRFVPQPIAFAHAHEREEDTQRDTAGERR